MPPKFFSQMNVSLLLQIAAALMIGAALLWNLALLLWILYPAGSGEWLRLVEPASLFVSLPLSFIAAVILIVVKNGSPRLRQICICGWVAALLFTVVVYGLAAGLFHRHNTPFS